MPGHAEVPEARAAARPRRRGRTALLISAAAVIGLVGGTCAGYLVQADRAPTKLPPLSQPTLKQSAGEAPEPLSAARDRRVKTDGDLRKLLLKKPAGAKDAQWLEGLDGWMDLAGYAGTFEGADQIFANLVSDEFRRAAVTGWQSGSSTVEIRLVQFRQEEAVAADDIGDKNLYWGENASTESWPVPGTGDGMAHVHSEPETEVGYMPLYSADAYAWRGDIAMEIWVYDSKPITKKRIMDLAERQMERL
ncbi:hypothetical protein [Streptomyces bicolor]|uniref:hypothetical protein n=1 Tax=Streptomyces bicolor TaxID=66874 RepID=UPI001F436584|nr:hypothetical protein [Streptomyces bicolor]